MTDPARVSVIIPCYNAEQFVGEAIESALAQTYPNVEVVAIDDGSTDGSAAVLKSFGERIHWETRMNKGACAARNRGLALAKGEFIQFLDSDDLLHPQKVTRQLKEMDRPGADIVICLGESDDASQAMNSMYHRRYNGEDPVVFVLGGILPTPAPLHRRKNLLTVGGFREDLPCAQERDLHLRLACAGLRFRQVPEVLFTVRHVSCGLSSDSVRVLEQHARIAWPAYQTLRDKGELSDERAEAFAGMLASDARAYLRHGRADKSAEYFVHARRMHLGGGLTRAYSAPTRWLRRFLGAGATEKLVSLKRRAF